LGLLHGCRLVNAAQIGCYLSSLLPGRVVQAVAHHVDNAQLHHGLWKHRFNGLRKAFEPIDAGDEDVLRAPVA